jgi:hypothetical protein
MKIKSAADVNTGDKVRILNVKGIEFADKYFQDGDVVEVKVAPEELFGMPLGDFVFIKPADATAEEIAEMGEEGLIVMSEELANIEKVADDTPLTPRNKVEGLGNHADEITLDSMFNDGNVHMYTPKFKKGERVQTLPGASFGTASVKDGEVYEIGEVTYVGEGDFLYRMGADAGNFVCEDEIELIEKGSK